MDEKMIFDMIKRIIYEQNQKLLQELAPLLRKDVAYLEEKYLRREYYLPMLEVKVRK